MRKRKKWNEERNKNIILTCYSEGILTISYLYNNYGGMVRAIKEDYGSLELFFKKIGIPYDEIYKYEHWSKERILGELKIIYKKGVLTPTYLRENHRKLLDACYGHFGSLENALEKCGISYDETRITKMWSKEKVENEIMVLHSKSLLTPTSVRETGGLIDAIERLYGSLKNVVEDLGISYEEILMRENWNREKVINKLLELHNSEENIQSIYLKTNYTSLHSACVRIFGSFEKAILSTGLTLEKVYGSNLWGEERIISNLQKLGVKGILETENFAIEYRSLYSACYREFGSFMNACKAARLSVEEIQRNRPYMDKKSRTKEEVVKELRDWFVVMKKSHRDLFLENSKLEKAARVHFGTLRKALKAIDVDYEKRWKPTAKAAGTKFENIVEEVFEELNYPILLRNKKIYSVRPDFILADNMWVDAKLSAWTQTIPSTIKKYSKYCKELWIVYLFCNSERKDSEKVKFMSIEKFINLLPLEKRNHYYEKLEDLKYWLDVTRDIS